MPVTFANGAIGVVGAALGVLFVAGEGDVPGGDVTGAAQAAISIGNQTIATRM